MQKTLETRRREREETQTEKEKQHNATMKASKETQQ
jgi:hypothetical protein